MFIQFLKSINLLIIAIHFQKYRVKNEHDESEINYSEIKNTKYQFVSSAYF